MNNYALDLLMLMSRLTQLNNKKQIINSFVESINTILPTHNICWKNEKENDIKTQLPVNTSTNTYGFVQFNKGIISDTELLELLQNAVQLLAVILEKVEQNEFLERQKSGSPFIVNKKDSRESELKLQHLFEYSGIGIVLFDLNGQVVSLNQRYLKYLGGKAEDYIGKLISEIFMDGSSVEYMRRIRLSINNENEQEYEELVKFPSGSFWFLSNYSRVGNTESEVTGVLVISHDITTLKNSQKLLSETNYRYKNLFNNSGVSVVIIGKDGKYLEVNKKAAENFGMPIEEIEKKSIYEFFPHQKAKKYIEANQALINSGGHREYEDTFLLKNSYKTFLIVDQCLQDHNGLNYAVQSSSIDITEWKLTEHALRKSEEKFRKVFSTSPDAVTLTRLDDGLLLSVNKGFCSIFGYTEEEVFGKKSLDMNIWVEPKDRQNVVEKLKKDGVVTNHEARFRKKNGEIIYGLISASSIDLNGMNCVLDITRDITERKEAEDALYKIQRKFKERFEDAPVGYHEIDTNGNVILVNSTELKMLGYTIDEMIGQPIWNFVKNHEMSRQAVLQKLSGKVLPGEPFERAYIHKDGRLIPVLIQEKILKDENDNIIGIRSILQDITEHKIVEEALKESEKKYRQFIETAVEGICAVDKDENITLVNQQMAEMFGYTSAEIVGLKFTSLLFPEDINDHKLKIENRTKGKGEIYERRFKRKDGNILWALVSASAILTNNGEFDGSFGMFTDITSLKVADEILRESEERYRSVAQSANDAIITADRNGIILDWNKGAEKIFGYSEEEVTGKELTAILPKAYLEAHIQGIRRVEQGGEHHIISKTVELHGLHKNGKEFPLELSLAEWKTASGKFFTGIIRDITERKHAEEVLRLSKERAELSDKLKTEFLAQMSHEIRSPMNSVLSFANLLREDLGEHLTEDNLEYLDGIDSAGHRLMRTVELIINASEIQVGTYEPTFIQFDLIKEVINKIINDYAKIALGKSLELKLFSNLPLAIIYGDKYSIYQLFLNLMDNAVKYTVKGYVAIHISSRDDNQNIQVTIEDTGIGMSDEYLNRLFQPFTQEDRGYSRKFEGNGLGLSLVKKYCDLNGITLTVESKKGEGSKFILFFCKQKLV